MKYGGKEEERQRQMMGFKKRKTTAEYRQNARNGFAVMLICVRERKRE